MAIRDSDNFLRSKIFLHGWKSDMYVFRAFLVPVALLWGTCSIFGQTSLERDLAGNAYRPHDPVAEDLKIVGSRSMSTLLDQWGEGLKKHQPKLKLDLDCEGS